jgi:hypothetical protein
MGSFKFIDYQKIALVTSHKQGLNSLRFLFYFHFHVSFVFFSLPPFLSYGDFLKINFSLFLSSSSLFYMFQRFFWLVLCSLSLTGYILFYFSLYIFSLCCVQIVKFWSN